MKNLILTFACLLSLSGWAKQIAEQKSALNPLLVLYYDIKDALVKDDGNTASQKADEFQKALKSIDETKLTAKEQKALKPLKEKLAFDSQHMAETKDVSHQRDHFSSFSDNMIKLAKAAKISDTPVYQMYCPMKKTSWMSNENKVMNPYYGKQMLTCGKVTETIK